MKKAEIEAITKIVYGETFNRYNREEFLEFLRPLEVRLEQNGIDQSVFSGKKCLDAGCGGGRGSVLMGRAGAAEVLSYDLSETNVATTKRVAEMFFLDNVKTQCGSLLEIPYPDETFDFVWCNGVAHHTAEPDRALSEIMRVLKVGGHAWLYLYGSGGIYWYMVDFLREWLEGTDIRLTILALDMIGTPTGRIAEFIDDWYVPMLKRYTDADVRGRLAELGAPDPQYLKGGMSYDTSQRRGDDRENLLMGGGDLRYWIEKTSPPTGANEHPLPDVAEKGSAYDDAPEVTSFKKDFDELAAAVAELEGVFPEIGVAAKIASAAALQTRMRDMLTMTEPFDPEAYRAFVRGRTEQIMKYLAK